MIKLSGFKLQFMYQLAEAHYFLVLQFLKIVEYVCVCVYVRERMRERERRKRGEICEYPIHVE